MPAVDLRTLPTIPYVYSATTTATINKCQIVQIPTSGGVSFTVHNRDKASKTLRMSFDPALVQDGNAPSVFFYHRLAARPRARPGRGERFYSADAARTVQ